MGHIVELGSPMLHVKIQDHRTFGSGEGFKSFYHIRARRPTWSRDLGNLYKLSFPISKEVSHEICLWLAKRSQRRRTLRDSGRTEHRYIIISHCEPHSSCTLSHLSPIA